MENRLITKYLSISAVLLIALLFLSVNSHSQNESRQKLSQTEQVLQK
jgi:YbbR domain-containing protein